MDFKQLTRMKHGQVTLPAVWIIIVISMFVVTTVYILFNQIITDTMYDVAVEQGANTETLGVLMTAWQAWPILFFIALFLFGLANSGSVTYSQRRIY